MHQVTSEFIDAHTGRRVKPGELFTPADAEQAERLVRAGCLVRVAAEEKGGGPTEDAPAEAPRERQKRRR